MTPRMPVPALMSAKMIAVALALSACSAGRFSFDKDGSYGVAAGRLDPDLVRQATTAPAQNNLGIVALLVNDSRVKCTAFLNQLIAAESTTDTSLDIASTILSALATAFTPLATVHGLTAAATIATGSKTAIDTDVYSKASIANFAQAVQTTYGSDLKTYWTAKTTAGASVIPVVELPTINAIHAECALGPAEASIGATLQSASQSSGGQPPGGGGNATAKGANPPAPNPLGPTGAHMPVPGHPVVPAP
jgi:hypothetical protein